jgi:hypothetical protein
MKSLYLRSGLALLCAVILSACGGGNGSLQLSGTISGLAKPGLVLRNTNTGEDLPIASGSGSFVFTKLAAVDEQFNVIIQTQPTGAHCDASANTGKANAYNAYYIVITCTTNSYQLGGTVNNLRGNGLALANGFDTVAILPPATAGAAVNFVFTTNVADGSLFGATVLTQPAGQTCKVDPSNNPGTMPSGNQLGLIVNCVNN